MFSISHVSNWHLLISLEMEKKAVYWKWLDLDIFCIKLQFIGNIQRFRMLYDHFLALFSVTCNIYIKLKFTF